MDLSDVVMKAKQQHANGNSKAPPKIDLHAAQAVAGSTSSTVPEGRQSSSPTSFLHPSQPNGSGSHATPPHSPLRKQTSGSSSTASSPAHAAAPTSKGRPKHRSQASFDWFGEHPSRSPERMPRGSGRTESPGGGSSGVSNAAALRFGEGGRAKVQKRFDGDVPLAESPMERSEDEDEAGEVGQEKTNEVGRQAGAEAGGLRGAFTAEDKERGAKALRKWSGDSPSDGAKGKDRRRSASMGASDREKEGQTRGRSLSLSRANKAKSTRTAGGGGDTTTAGEEETDWEDENRDQFADSAPQSPHNKRHGGQHRKQSLWGSLARSGGGEQSGTSTPEGGSDTEGGGGSGGERRPSQQRRGSAWGVVRSKLKTGSGSEKDKEGKKKGKTGESLTGHELISVSHLASSLSCSLTHMLDLTQNRNSPPASSRWSSSRCRSWTATSEATTAFRSS